MRPSPRPLARRARLWALNEHDRLHRCPPRRRGAADRRDDGTARPGGASRGARHRHGGEAGLAETATPDLGGRRADELARAAAPLGCARTVLLGYPDSGMREHPVAPVRDAFARQPVHVPTRRLADLLCEEQADAVCCYDPAGGYGHPDHVQVHRIGLAAAELARTPVVLQATVDRRALQRALRMLKLHPPRRPRAASRPLRAAVHRP